MWRKNQDIKVTVGPAVYSEERLALYNRHKLERGLSLDGKTMTQEGYEGWFVRMRPDGRDLLPAHGRLVGVSIIDVGADTSSVYHYFDPDLSDRSLDVLGPGRVSPGDGVGEGFLPLPWPLRRSLRQAEL